MSISVDFCRGSGGAFLAINGLVVAGAANGDGSGRVIMAFEIEGEDLLRALALQKAAGDGAEKDPSPAAIATRRD